MSCAGGQGKESLRTGERFSDYGLDIAKKIETVVPVSKHAAHYDEKGTYNILYT